jgi:hypothetical protein
MAAGPGQPGAVSRQPVAASARIIGVTAKTRYDFRAVVSTAGGVGYGAMVSFTAH